MLFLDLIRTLVSGDKRRYRNEQYNLDFSYITDRIIAMAFPGEGIEAMWRNNAATVAKMLKKKHQNYFKIYNLSERRYSYEKFDGQVVEFGFPDHHNPPMDYLMAICESMHEWLTSDPKNVAVVHCLAGRGRTGTVIACYLNYCGMFKSGAEAMDFFARRRSTIHRGVERPSQRRYVQYFSEYLAGFKPNEKPLRLLKVVMYGVPAIDKYKGCCPVLEIYTAESQHVPKKLLWSSYYHSHNHNNPENNFYKGGGNSTSTSTTSSSKTSTTTQLPPPQPRYYTPDHCCMHFDNINCELLGDIKVFCYHLDRWGNTTATAALASKNPVVLNTISSSSSSSSSSAVNSNNRRQCYSSSSSSSSSEKQQQQQVNKKCILRFSFHTGFVTQHGNMVLRLKKHEIDEAYKDKRFDNDFMIDLLFGPTTTTNNSSSSSNNNINNAGEGESPESPTTTSPPPSPSSIISSSSSSICSPEAETTTASTTTTMTMQSAQWSNNSNNNSNSKNSRSSSNYCHGGCGGGSSKE